RKGPVVSDALQLFMGNQPASSVRRFLGLHLALACPFTHCVFAALHDSCNFCCCVPFLRRTLLDKMVKCRLNSVQTLDHNCQCFSSHCLPHKMPCLPVNLFHEMRASVAEREKTFAVSFNRAAPSKRESCPRNRRSRLCRAATR